jgi:hypothetical protein
MEVMISMMRKEMELEFSSHERFSIFFHKKRNKRREFGLEKSRS